MPAVTAPVTAQPGDSKRAPQQHRVPPGFLCRGLQAAGGQILALWGAGAQCRHGAWLWKGPWSGCAWAGMSTEFLAPLQGAQLMR